MNQFKAGNFKNKLPNWQKITKNKELFGKIKGAKILLNRIPRKFIVIMHPLHKQKLRLWMQKSQSFFKRD